MKLQKKLTVLLSVSMVVLIVVSPRAFAAPDYPFLDYDARTALFQGNQSLGIWPALSWYKPIYTFNVNTLTTDITPTAGVPGIKLFRSGANGTNGISRGSDDAGGAAGNGGPGGLGGEIVGFTFLSPAVDFSGGIYEIMASGANAFGIGAVSTGGTGGNGGNRVGYSIWGLEIFNAVAGHGGAGGWGLPVTVTSDGTIRTDGSSSDGILARSQGGDGGYGGHALTSVLSATAGNGGAGGAAWSGTVTSYGSIYTNGADSAGIRVLIQGGDGGDGGHANGGTAAVAGAGGAGGISLDATVTNYASIDTSGPGSPGIFALSDGGDGGDGGDALGGGASAGNGGPGGSAGTVSVENHGNIQTAGDSADGIIAASLGGAGGSGGSASGIFGNSGIAPGTGLGGAVEVTNTGDILTTGTDVRGIFAQSIGGFSGDVGGATGLVGLAGWGGSSDSGGDGGTVIVTNNGAITTTGSSSERIGGAIVAKSIGGGGGDAGLVAGMITIGGAGSAGGNGGDVTVENSGPLQTIGRNANGILAESIGGGGGDGASSVNAGLFVSVGLGGSGESGGDGGNVTVDSEATSITTAGDLSHGIQAQSVGGGGGNGGSVVSYTTGLQFTAGLSLGGNGGDGGDGGQVNLTSASQITTQGEHAHGLYAESVGGGGGSGGNALARTLGIGIPISLPSISTSISMGGSGGAGGSGQAVTVSSTGDISTSASNSYGILAQSVGGGGGYAGNSTAGNIAFNSYTVTIAVGGSGDIGGSGDAVQVDSGGNIATQGDFAYGILGQSIGGGGGVAGSSKTLVTDIQIPIGTSPSDFLLALVSPDLNVTLSLGGKAGGGGDGGAVDIISTGHIDTQGEFAHGILAQSVGGGGGAGGDSTNVDTELIPNLSGPLDFMNVDGKVLLGGSGGAGGQGGVVNVESQGNISTEGNFANGILAQSIGGGGGAGGYIHTHTDVYDFTKPMSSMELGIAVGGYGGDGGDVTVENSGDITTHGGFAHGILAQSIGGGGGFGGISEDFGWSILQGFLYNGVSAQNTDFGVGFAGSAGGLGSAGAVNVTHTGSITTLGDMSHGILAQSASGSGTAGPVTVTLASDITANGMNSDGIHAQSVGGSGNGDISINIGGGTVRGGSGTGAGVNIDGGAINTLTNAGSISALSGLSIIGGVGDDTVYNNGIVTGTVDLGAGVNAFYNNLTGTFNSGAIVNLGAGNTLTNAGVFSPGGLGTVLKTSLTGDFQLASGLFEIEIGGFTPGSFDFLDITGTAFLPGGNINFSFLDGYDIVTDVGPGETWELSFLHAGNIDNLFDPVINYNFTSLPYFQFDVFRMDNSLYFQATNMVPLPGAVLLGSIGLCIAGVKLRKYA